ncbi:MAG TPA: hypothetical protein VGC99_02420 [Candidatus Tectomicrobia bacterium]
MVHQGDLAGRGDLAADSDGVGHQLREGRLALVCRGLRSSGHAILDEPQRVMYERTSRMRLGIAVVLPPLHHPGERGSAAD